MEGVHLRATMDAVVKALMESETVRAALTPYTTALAEAIAREAPKESCGPPKALLRALGTSLRSWSPSVRAFSKMREELAGTKVWEDAQRGAATAVENALRAGARAALEGEDVTELGGKTSTRARWMPWSRRS